MRHIVNHMETMINQNITLVIIFIYFIIQSISDYKTMEVYKTLNNIFMILSIVLYILDCIYLKVNPTIECLIVMIILLLFYMLRYFGKGDLKAFIVIYFASRYNQMTFPHPNLGLFLIAILTAIIIFLLLYAIYKISKNTTKIKIDENGKKRAAFFPALTCGYIVSTLLAINL